MGLFQKLLGICDTSMPQNDQCWSFRADVISVDLNLADELSKPQGALRIEKKGMKNRYLVVRGNHNDYYAFLNKCTHGGRRLDPVAGEKQIKCCSMGQARFTYEGRSLNPDLSDITMYDVQHEGNFLKIFI